MAFRMFSLSVAALAFCAAASLNAGEVKKSDETDRVQRANKSHDGTVVSVTAEKLVMKGKAVNGKQATEHSHTLAADAKVTCDGKACKLEDLKAGQKVRVTTRTGSETVATRVEAIDRNESFERPAGGAFEKKAGDGNRR